MPARRWPVDVKVMVLLLLIALAPMARAQEAVSGNAAAHYRHAIEQYKTIKTSITSDQWTMIDYFMSDPTGLLSPQIRQWLERFSPVIDQVNRATAMPVCDFGNAGSGDFFAPNTQLADMRNLARMLHYDMFMRMCDGDESAVLDRTIAALRMGNQLAQDDALMPQLVGNAIFSLGNNMSMEIADGGLLTAEGAHRLLPLFQFADSQDPRGVRTLLRNVPHQIQQVTGKLNTEEGRARLLEYADWIVGENLMAQWGLLGMSDQDWRNALRKCEALSQRISDVAGEPDIEKMKAALDTIQQEINHGDHGPFANGLLGYCRNLPMQMEHSAKQFGQTRQMLEDVASGKTDPTTLGNAAMVYLRAIAMISAMDREKLAAIRLLAAQEIHTATAIDEAMVRTLEEAQPIIDLLRQASALRKCEFTMWDTINRSHPGMRDTARLLHADAARLFTAGHADQAFDRIAIALRMCSQLSRQREIMFSVIAQAVVNRTEALITGAISKQWLNTEQLSELSTVLESFNKNDPFGLDNAVATAREQWRQMFGKDWASEKDKSPALIKRATDFVNHCDGDDFLWFAVALQEAYKDLPWRVHDGASGYVTPLDDIIAMDIFGPAMAQVQPIRTIIDHNDFERLGDFESPAFAHVEQHRADARSDYQRIRRRLPVPERVMDAAAGSSTQPGNP